MQPSYTFPLEVWSLIANNLDYDGRYYLAKSCKQLHTHLMKGFADPIYVTQAGITLDALKVWWIERPGTYILTENIHCNKVRFRSRKGTIVIDGQKKYNIYFDLTHERLTKRRDIQTYLWKGKYIDNPIYCFCPNGASYVLRDLGLLLASATDDKFQVCMSFPVHGLYVMTGPSPFRSDEENAKKLQEEAGRNYAMFSIENVACNRA